VRRLSSSADGVWREILLLVENEGGSDYIIGGLEKKLEVLGYTGNFRVVLGPETLFV